jgi:hypothetical protein
MIHWKALPKDELQRIVNEHGRMEKTILELRERLEDFGIPVVCPKCGEVIEL